MADGQSFLYVISAPTVGAGDEDNTIHVEFDWVSQGYDASGARRGDFGTTGTVTFDVGKHRYSRGHAYALAVRLVADAAHQAGDTPFVIVQGY